MGPKISLKSTKIAKYWPKTILKFATNYPKIVLQNHHKIEPKIGLKLAQNWLEIGSKLTPKSAPKLVHHWIQNLLKISPQISQKSNKNQPKIGRKLSQNLQRII
jgi:hypothetical protein